MLPKKIAHKVKNDNLYEEFQAEMAVRKSKLDGIKTEEGEAFQAIRQRWNDKRQVLQKYPMLHAHRQQLLLEMKGCLLKAACR